MAETEQRIIDRCEAMGESAVRSGLVAGDFGDSSQHPMQRVVEAWLAAKDSAKRNAREEETLAIAKAANRLAFWAIIIAAIAAATSIAAIAISQFK